MAAILLRHKTTLPNTIQGVKMKKTKIRSYGGNDIIIKKGYFPLYQTFTDPSHLEYLCQKGCVVSPGHQTMKGLPVMMI